MSVVHDGMTNKSLTVFCPKEEKDVLVWFCLGSFVQQREICPNVMEMTVNYPEGYAEVKCRLVEEVL